MLFSKEQVGTKWEGAEGNGERRADNKLQDTMRETKDGKLN